MPCSLRPFSWTQLLLRLQNMYAVHGSGKNRLWEKQDKAVYKNNKTTTVGPWKDVDGRPRQSFIQKRDSPWRQLHGRGYPCTLDGYLSTYYHYYLHSERRLWQNRLTLLMDELIIIVVVVVRQKSVHLRLALSVDCRSTVVLRTGVRIIRARRVVSGFHTFYAENVIEPTRWN